MKQFRIPTDLKVRHIYSVRVEPFIRKPVVKVFTGQRRVGKSYILYQIMGKIESEDPGANIIYINMEDSRFSFIRNYIDLVEYVGSKKAKRKVNYIFIDEIQDITGFENGVRSLLLDKGNDIYITGSNARLLSGELATLLGGRTLEFRIYGLSYSEFLHFHRIKDTDVNLEKYFLYGGLPFLINLKMTDSIIFEYLRNIYNTIVFRDVVSRHHLRNTYFLEQLIRFMADNTGSLFSAKSISDFLRSQKVMIPHNQVQAYTGFLTESFLIHKVLRYDISGKRFFETGEKYFFEDTGIRNAVIGFKPGDRGKLLENVVHNELLYRGYEVRTGSMGTRETDFVAIKDNETIYIQVALRLDNEKTVSREFGNLLAIEDNYPKMVITGGEQYRNTLRGIEHINIRRFLTGQVEKV